MKCHGIHCDGCGHGSGGAGLAAAAVLVIIIAAGIKAHGRAIGEFLEIAGWTVFGICVAVAAGLIGWQVRRHMLKVRDRRIPPRARAVIIAARAGQVSPAETALRPPVTNLPAGLAAAGDPGLLHPLPDQAWAELIEGFRSDADQDGDR